MNTLNNEKLCENIPFANENIIDLTPIQSERLNHQSIDLPISTITNKFLLFPSNHLLIKSSSFYFILLLIFLFLITNTIDIVLIYIYYHLHYIYLISYLSTIILCDIILWLNNFIQSKTRILPSYFLLIPFSIRFYLLYKLLELLLIILDRNKYPYIFNSLYKINKSKLYQNLILFYLIHTGFLSFINLYFWSNNFQLSTEIFLNMDYFIPQWIINNQLLSSISISSSDPIPASSIFVFVSILYYLIINYSLLSTYLIFKRLSLLIIISRLCLIISRLYTLIFLFHLNAWWLSMIFVLVHLILMITLLFDQSKYQRKSKRIFLQIIFSFLTHQSIDDLPINIVISLENISIFLHRIYLEYLHIEITWRLIIFISILISLQIIGFLINILSKYILYRTKTITKL
jgi:hypothetical protein